MAKIEVDETLLTRTIELGVELIARLSNGQRRKLASLLEDMSAEQAKAKMRARLAPQEAVAENAEAAAEEGP